ncbi:MAG: DUF2809 domain-containing protein [Bacteroidia bacterium]|nr:DUF2809 domain-containing protein [Bacteroidia bacterium]
MRIFRLNSVYLLAALFLLAIEIWIALVMRDAFVRPILGDFLVVILLYCGLLALGDFSRIKTAVGVLLFAWTVEGLQYLRVVEWLGLSHSALARTIIGTSFSWHDVWAYTLGIVAVLLVEWVCGRLRDTG